MTNLNEVTGMNTYCGPAVLAALTGKSTDLCASVISSISGQREIKAVQVADLLRALDKLDFIVKSLSYGGSLYGTIVSLVSKGEAGFFIVLVPRHVVALEVAADKKVYFIDNHTKHAINAAASARLSQRVEGLYQVKAKPVKSKYDIGKERVAWLKSMIDYYTDSIRVMEEKRLKHEEELNQLEIELYGEQ